MATDKRTFVILGPDDGDGIPQHWDREFWQWMEGAAGDSPSSSCIYTEAEIDFPLGEFPVGVVSMVCLETGHQLTSPMWGGSENKI